MNNFIMMEFEALMALDKNLEYFLEKCDLIPGIVPSNLSECWIILRSDFFYDFFYPVTIALTVWTYWMQTLKIKLALALYLEGSAFLDMSIMFMEQYVNFASRAEVSIIHSLHKRNKCFFFFVTPCTVWSLTKCIQIIYIYILAYNITFDNFFSLQ